MEYLFLGGVLVENRDRAPENLLFGLVSARILGKGLKENKKEGQRITISERNFNVKLSVIRVKQFRRMDRRFILLHPQNRQILYIAMLLRTETLQSLSIITCRYRAFI
jgi:hypothetical protein